jgi:hypothetical protein
MTTSRKQSNKHSNIRGHPTSTASTPRPRSAKPPITEVHEKVFLALILLNKFKALSTSPHLANMSINALLSSALFCTLPFHRKTPRTSLTRAHLNPYTHSNWNHYDLIRTNTLDLQFPKQTNRITRPPHLHVSTNHRTPRNGIQLAHFIEHLSWKLNPSFPLQQHISAKVFCTLTSSPNLNLSPWTDLPKFKSPIPLQALRTKG